MKWTTLVMSSALVACAACGRNADTPATDTQTTGSSTGTAAAGAVRPGDDQGAAAQQAMFEGCVQRGGGLLSNELLLTMMNEPSGVAGTSGSITKTGSAVERDQMRVAARTFRLRVRGPVDLDTLVGKQVRLTATISQAADVPNGNGAIGSSGDSQKPNRSAAQRLDQDPQISVADLGRLDVTSAVVTGEACGAIGREMSGRTDDSMVGTDRSPRSNR